MPKREVKEIVFDEGENQGVKSFRKQRAQKGFSEVRGWRFRLWVVTGGAKESARVQVSQTDHRVCKEQPNDDSWV